MKKKRASAVFHGIFLAGSLLAGSLLAGTPVYSSEIPLLKGRGGFGVAVETDVYSRDIKKKAGKDRLKVARQGFQVSYGVHRMADLFLKFGVGKIDFSDSNLRSRTRPYGGAGLRLVSMTPKGYFGGFSFELLKGKTGKFQFNDQTLTIKDDWTEQNMALFIGTKDLIGGPVQSGRIFAGLRFSSRVDDLTFEDGSGDKGKEDSPIGGYLGFEFSDSDIFNARVELGTGDRNSIFVSLGLVF